MSTFELVPALVGAGVSGLGAGVVMPPWVRALPEPEDPADDKVPYARLGAGVAPAYTVAGAVVGGAVAGVLGWQWPLLFLLPSVALGVALAHVDFRTRLLPKRLVLPAYPALLVLLLAVAALQGRTSGLVTAAWGWLVASLLYWCLWRFTRGMGYGDVRLSGLIGLALGYFGWSTLLVGLYAGFVVGVVGWVLLRLTRVVKDRHFAFGPFMLLGAALGVVLVGLGWSPLAV